MQIAGPLKLEGAVIDLSDGLDRSFIDSMTAPSNFKGHALFFLLNDNGSKLVQSLLNNI